MTEQASTSNRRPRRAPLYRTVLSVAVAALMAAWLPFTVMYVTALNNRATVAVSTWKAGHPVLTTKTSGGQVIQTSAPAASSSQAAPATAHVPVTTRAS